MRERDGGGLGPDRVERAAAKGDCLGYAAKSRVVLLFYLPMFQPRAQHFHAAGFKRPKLALLLDGTLAEVVLM